MPYLTVHGVRLYYSARARGNDVIVFVHGAGGNHLNWYYQLEFLDIPLTLIALDLPGHGNSSGQPCDEISCYSEFLSGFIEKFNPEGKLILAGHSMGGLVVLNYLLKRENTDAAILLGSACKLSHREPPKNPEEFCKNLFYSEESIKRCLKTADTILRRAKGVVEYDLKAAGEADLCDKIKKINAPILLIMGEEDKLVNLESVKRTAESLMKSELKVIPRAGHMVMIEKFQVVNGVISEWVGQLRKS